MTNYSQGHEAEKKAAKYLRKSGLSIRELNWHTRYCEIDNVAEKSQTIYFAEVKYRQTDRQGRGLDYITSKKLHQMNFAADMWVSPHNWTHECQLVAIEVSGEDFTVTNFVENIF